MKSALLIALSLFLNSCGNESHPVQTTPGNSSWIPVAQDSTITIKYDKGHGLPLMEYDVLTSTITVNGAFSSVIAWKDGDFINAVAYNPISSGSSLIRLKPADKTVIYLAPSVGIGPIDHSQYGNKVHVFVNDGLVMIAGYESAGNYSEIRRLSDGSLVNISQEFKPFHRPEYIRIK